MQDYSFDEHFDKYPIAMAYVPWQHFEKMYDDLKVTELQQKSGTTAQLENVTNWFKTLNRADFDPIGWNAITDAVKTQLSRHY